MPLAQTKMEPRPPLPLLAPSSSARLAKPLFQRFHFILLFYFIITIISAFPHILLFCLLSPPGQRSRTIHCTSIVIGTPACRVDVNVLSILLFFRRNHIVHRYSRQKSSKRQLWSPAGSKTGILPPLHLWLFRPASEPGLSFLITIRPSTFIHPHIQRPMSIYIAIHPSIHQVLTPPMPELKATPTEQTELFPSAATWSSHFEQIQ